MRKINLILFISLLNFCFGQNAKLEKQLDIVATDNYVEEKVIPMGIHGFIIHSRQKFIRKGMITMKYSKYNADMELIGEKELNIKMSLVIKDYFVEDNLLYMAYTHNGGGEFTITKYDILTGELKEFTGVFEKGTQVREFNVLNGIYYFVCSVGDKYSMVIVNIVKEEIITQPLNFNEILPKIRSLSNFQVLKKSNELALSVDFRVSVKEIKTYFVVFNEKAEITNHYDLSQNKDKFILNSNAINTEDGGYIVSGDYSLSESLKVSNGLYIALIKEGKVDKINYYNFADLKNFFAFESDRNQSKFENRKEKAGLNGNELVVSYLLLTHDILKIENDYLFLAEAFLPGVEVSGSAATYGGATVNSSGYQYTHAFMFRFDKDANIIWDQSIRMNFLWKSNYPKKFINVSKNEQGNFNFVFADGNLIKSKKIDTAGNTIEEVNLEIIGTSEGEENTLSSNTRLYYWYDTYFLNSGFYKKNINPDERIDRLVLFIKKFKL